MQTDGRIRIENQDPWTDLTGKRHHSVPEYLQTEETPVDSNWTDVKGYVRSARYPTENPEELLERVICSSSKEGDVVLDSFAGSGTTNAVAESLGADGSQSIAANCQCTRSRSGCLICVSRLAIRERR